MPEPPAGAPPSPTAGGGASWLLLRFGRFRFDLWRFLAHGDCIELLVCHVLDVAIFVPAIVVGSVTGDSGVSWNAPSQAQRKRWWTHESHSLVSGEKMPLFVSQRGRKGGGEAHRMRYIGFAMLGWLVIPVTTPRNLP